MIYSLKNCLQAPTLAAKWDGILEATKYGPQCAQKMWITNQNLGDENCLHLQVFTPSVSKLEFLHRFFDVVA